MIYYADTSALLKKYILEAESNELIELLSDADYVITSFLTELEISATFERAKKMKRIDSPAYREVFRFFEKEIESGIIALIPFDATIHKISKRLVRQRFLRAPDAIQLATVLSLGSSFNDNGRFVCSDKSLIEAARLEGLRCCALGA